MRTKVVAIALPLLLLAGCAMAGSDEAATEGGAPDMDFDSGAPAEEARGDGEFGLEQPATERQVITTGSVTMTSDDPRATAQEISELVEDRGGRVEERVEQAAKDDEEASAYLLVRVPSAAVTTMLDTLEHLGTVEDVSLTRTDVTMQVVDLDARIRAREISVTRLEDLLARAESTADLVAAESALTQRQSELESLLSQRAHIADQVSLSTLRINVWTTDAVPAEPPEGFWGGLVAGWESFVDAVRGFLVGFGFLVPWLVFFGVIVVAIVIAVRRRRRRRPPSSAHPGATAYPQPPAPPAAPEPAPPAPAAAPVADAGKPSEPGPARRAPRKADGK